MEHIISRTQLIEHIATHAKRSALRRACHTGKVEVLGGFSSIPPSTAKGFIVFIQSIHKHVWYVAVTANEVTRTWDVWTVGEVPWENYVGTSMEPNIYNGDDPWYSSLQRGKQLPESEPATDTTSKD